jgi:single-stranded DNA-binding protein
MPMCNPLKALLLAVSSTLPVMDTWCDNLGKGSKVYVEGRLENTEHTTVTSNIFTVSALRAARSSRNPSPIVPQQCHAIEASAQPSRNPSPIPLVIASREYRLPRAGRPAVRRFRSSFKRADDQKNQQANTEENSPECGSYVSSDLLYELKAAWDKLNSSSHNGLFLALFGTDPLVLRSLCHHHMAAFSCAEFLDIRAEREHV